MEGLDPKNEAPPAVRWPIPLIFLVGFGLFLFGLLTSSDAVVAEKIGLSGAILLLGVAWFAAVRLKESWQPRLLAVLEEYSQSVEALPERHLAWWIGLASAVGLFAELTLIRWHASAFQLFAYFKNVSLLAAFLGLGLGYALGRRRPLWLPLALPALSLQFLSMQWLRFSSLQEILQNPITEQQALGLARVGFGSLDRLSHTAVSYGFLIVIFTATVLTCIPLGQLASALMRRRPPLEAYGSNLLGSLAGIGLFSLVSYMWSPPAVWLLVTALGIVPFLLLYRPALVAWPSLLVTGLAVLMLAVPFRLNQVEIYSPYQYLAVEIMRGTAPSLQVNHTYYQKVLDLRADALQRDPEQGLATRYYDLPYKVQPHPGKVLIVGSGTGNDVAAALRNQAGHVDAVEIDPAILELGRTIHAEKPYQDGRVDAINQDARSHIRRTDRRYDLIVYGLLDSHTVVSGMSNVRLDSFVYTMEAFREARARLTDSGIIAMTFSMDLVQRRKFFLMLQEAFDGQEPRVLYTNYNNGTMFLIGPGLARSGGAALPFPELTAELRASPINADLSTDDWPFLYMGVRKYPKSYTVMLAALLAVSLLLLYQLLPLGRDFSWPCFFLGAGFMLVETKGITELGLVFGNTWQVVSVVIAGILIMAYLANWVMGKIGNPPAIVTYLLLAAALGLGMNVSGSALLGLHPLLAQVAATALVTLPLFFSGFAFSGELKRYVNVPAALSANLFGAMLGGFCEYNSMYFGFRSLYVFASVLYGLAFVAVCVRALSGFLSKRKDGEASQAAGDTSPATSQAA
jgi:hypothetical protein